MSVQIQAKLAFPQKRRGNAEPLPNKAGFMCQQTTVVFDSYTYILHITLTYREFQNGSRLVEEWSQTTQSATEGTVVP